MALHRDFLSMMKRLLGDEYSEFEKLLSQKHFRGLRVNTLKYPIEKADELGLDIRNCPFSASGFYLDNEGIAIGNTPWHHAGAIYSQEPSAMSAVTVLDPQPGERVLDLCAAPGGKTGQMAAALDGRGLLWSNEYVRKRAQILLSNVERMGIRNCVVSSAHPDVISQKLSGFFDRVLVDAPCSGEGMFRRDERAVDEWSPEHSAACAVRQLAILESASKCLRENGVMVYSTCTFSPGENEGVIGTFLDAHPDFILEPCGVSFGRQGFDLSEKHDLTLTRRIFPMDGGEGHFVARMKKNGGMSLPAASFSPPIISYGEEQAEELFDECFAVHPYGIIRRIGDSCYILPEMMPETNGLGVLRGGVLLVM